MFAGDFSGRSELIVNSVGGKCLFVEERSSVSLGLGASVCGTESSGLSGLRWLPIRISGREEIGDGRELLIEEVRRLCVVAVV